MKSHETVSFTTVEIQFTWALPVLPPVLIVSTLPAVKADRHPAIIKVYASLGCAFDCASKGEIESVLSTGVDPADIVYANPFKAPEYIE